MNILFNIIKYICLAGFLFITFIFARVYYYTSVSECTYQNEILNSTKINSVEYNNELIRELERTKKLESDFWLIDYIDSTHFSVHINNDNLCTDMIVEVREDKVGIEHYMKVKGKSYAGNLYNFRYKIDHANSTIVFVCVEGIIE